MTVAPRTRSAVHLPESVSATVLSALETRGSALVDLHLHTTHSDGRLPPAAVVEAAALRGLRALAIVDHDVVSGLDEARDAGLRQGVEAIAGVELTTRWRGRTCHLLGYFLDPAAPPLRRALDQARSAAREAVEAGIALLRARGRDVSLADLQRFQARYPTPTTLLLTVLRRRLLRSRAELRALLALLRAGAPMTAPAGIALLHASGGAAVLAHPGRGPGFDADALGALAGIGLDGVEVAHPVHSAAQRARYAALAWALDLVATGGSDWHGRPRDLPPGGLGVAEPALDALRDRAARARRPAASAPA